MPGLPRSATPLIARRQERAAIQQTFADGARLVTLTGPGGTGKTRLAAAVIEARGAGLFAPLAAARTVGDICAVVARATGLPLGRRVSDPAASVAAELAARGPTLLVLDNTEQVAEAVAGLARRWLDEAPGLTILATSRWALDAPGEVALTVGPLSLAVVDGWSDAARLFVAAAPRQTVGDDAASRRQVEAIVGRVEGNPLAIELAAARLELLTLPRLLDRLEAHLGAGLKLLRDPSRPEARHGTLWNLVDWSFALLDAGERAALRQAAVFVDGFTLEAAEAVMALPGAEPLDALHGLRRRALLRVARDGRFRLHALVAEYAAARLADDGERAAIEARHARYYVTTAEGWAAAALAEDGAEAVRRLDTERANLMAAHGRALAADPPTGAAARQAMAVLHALRPLQNGHVPAAEQLALITATRALAERVDHGWPEAFAELLRGEARALRYAGRMAESIERLEQALAVCRDLPTREMQARVMTTLGEVLTVMGDPAGARAASSAALDLHRAAGDRRWQAMTLTNLAGAACGEGRFDEARERYVEAIALFEAVGDTHFTALAETNLATVALERGDVAFARVRFERTLALYEALGNPRSAAIGRSYLGLCDHHAGRLDAAEGCYAAVAEELDRLGARRFASYMRYYRAVLRLERHDPAGAAALFAAAGAALAALTDRRYEALVALGAAAAAIRSGRGDAGAEDRARQAIAGLGEATLHPAVELLDAAAALVGGAGIERWRARGAELSAAEGDDLRLLARVVVAWAEEAADAVASWVCAADGGWFTPPGSERVEVAHRVAPSRILAALLAAHRAGEPLSRDAAIAAGWPGESLLATAAGNRLRVALSTLRGLGLGALIQRAPKRAIRLDPAARIRIVR